MLSPIKSCSTWHTLRASAGPRKRAALAVTEFALSAAMTSRRYASSRFACASTPDRKACKSAMDASGRRLSTRITRSCALCPRSAAAHAPKQTTHARASFGNLHDARESRTVAALTSNRLGTAHVRKFARAPHVRQRRGRRRAPNRTTFGQSLATLVRKRRRRRSASDRT